MTERSSRESEEDENNRGDEQKQQDQQEDDQDQQQEPVLRKSCDYCARMKRACDGGSPCSLCCRRGKVCERRLRRKSGPAKGAKYAPRRRKLDNEVALTQAEAAAAEAAAAAAAAEAAAEAEKVAATTIAAMKANDSGPLDRGSGDVDGRGTEEPGRFETRTKTQSGHGDSPSGGPWPFVPPAALSSPPTRPLDAAARAGGREEGASPSAAAAQEDHHHHQQQQQQQQQQGRWGPGEWAKVERRGSGCSDGSAARLSHGVPPKKRFPSKGGVVREAVQGERRQAGARHDDDGSQGWHSGGKERGPWADEGADHHDQAGRDTVRPSCTNSVAAPAPPAPYSSYPSSSSCAPAAASRHFSRAETQGPRPDLAPRPIKNEEHGPVFSHGRAKPGRDSARGAQPARHSDLSSTAGTGAAGAGAEAAAVPREGAETARSLPAVTEGPGVPAASSSSAEEAAAAAAAATQGAWRSPQVKEEHALESMVGRVVSVSPLKRPREEDAHATDGRHSKPQVPAWEPAVQTGGIGFNFRRRVGPAAARQQNWGGTQAPQGQQPLAPKDLLFKLRPNDEDMIDIIANNDRLPTTSGGGGGGGSCATPGNGIGVVERNIDGDRRRAWSESRTCVEAGELLRAIRRDSAPEAPAAAAAASAAAATASPTRPGATREDERGATVSLPSSVRGNGGRSGTALVEPGTMPHRFSEEGRWRAGSHPLSAGHSSGGGSGRPPATAYEEAAAAAAAGGWREHAQHSRGANGFGGTGRGHGAVDIPTRRAHLSYGGGGGGNGSSAGRNSFEGYAGTRHSSEESGPVWRYGGGHSLPLPGLVGGEHRDGVRNADTAAAAPTAYLRPRDYVAAHHPLPRQQADHQAHQASLHHRALMAGALACDGVVEAGGGVRIRPPPPRGEWVSSARDPPTERAPYGRFAPPSHPTAASLACGRGGGETGGGGMVDVSVEEYWKGNRWPSRGGGGGGGGGGMMPVPASSHGRSDGPLRKRGLMARS